MRGHRNLATIVLLAISVKQCLTIICYKCDSVSLADCATSLDSNTLPTEECKSAYSCAMSIVDSVTYRGCITNTPTGSEYYKTCSENLCNKGVYPPGRLKCHHCNGTTCIAARTEKPTPCLHFLEEDFCYTDVIDEAEAYRGCHSDADRIPNIMAVFCEVNGCNDQAGVRTLTCAKCDSADGRGCKMDLFQVHSDSCNITLESTCSVKSILGHEEETCFLYHNLDRVVRGCSFDSGIISLDKEHFDICDEDLCNKRCLTQQKCVVCDSRTDERCKTDPTSLTAATCESPEASSCHACSSADGSVQRGCGAPARSAGSDCYQCEGEGCNTVPFRQCYKCSSADSSNCAQWLTPNAISVETCEIAGADCITAITMGGTTLRGCRGPQLTCNETLAECVRCEGSMCNDGVFPPMRLNCFQCDGREECSDLVDERNLRVCPHYESRDACFEFPTVHGIVRGCRSDQTIFYECLLAGTACRQCSSSGCNRNPVSRSASLRCHTCSREDEACAWKQTNETLQLCQKPVDFSSTESCFIRRYIDGSISRGCSLDNVEVHGSTEIEFLAHTCFTDGCNSHTTTIQTCKHCSGNRTTENICTTGAKKSESEFCKTANLTFERSGCYTWIDGDVIQRGCAADLEDYDLARCKNSEHCHPCAGMECNTATELTAPDSKGSGTDLRHTFVRYLMTLALFVIL